MSNSCSDPPASAFDSRCESPASASVSFEPGSKQEVEALPLPPTLRCLRLPWGTQNSPLPILPPPPHLPGPHHGHPGEGSTVHLFQSVLPVWLGHRTRLLGGSSAGTVGPAEDIGDVWRYLGDGSLEGGSSIRVRGQQPGHHLPVPLHRKMNSAKTESQGGTVT